MRTSIADPKYSMAHRDLTMRLNAELQCFNDRSTMLVLHSIYNVLGILINTKLINMILLISRKHYIAKSSPWFNYERK